MRQAGRDYFTALFASSVELVEKVPLTRQPAGMAHIAGNLQQATLSVGLNTVLPAPSEAVAKEIKLSTVVHCPVGLNTVGLLLDRLSILAIKHWNLLHRADSVARAAELRSGPAQEMIEALAAAQPGHASYNSKITVHGGRSRSGSFVQAYRGLLVTNLLLWEAQEILYNHDMQALPESELRAYIAFFSEHNLSRNAFMEDADRLFWAGSIEAGTPV